MSYRDWSRRGVGAVLLGAAAGLLGGCGFEPIAAPAIRSEGSDAIVLNSIRLEFEDTRLNYLVGRGLDRRVVVDATAPVRLVLRGEITEEGLAIRQNDTVTRFNLRADTTYQLQGSVESPVRSGDFSVVTAVNATTDYFATKVSRDEAIERLSEEIVRKTVTLLEIENKSAGSQI